MRHRKKLNNLSRKSTHRKAMLANMACSLILNKRITTTLAKAKALRIYVEPLITKSKNDTTHSRRVVFSYLKDKYAITELFRDIAQKIADRPGGYTRILKTGNRLGDNAEMCIIELVDYNETYSETKTETKAKTRRSRRRVGPKAEEKVLENVVDTDDKSTSETDTADKEISETDTPEKKISETDRPEKKISKKEEKKSNVVEKEPDIKEGTKKKTVKSEKKEKTTETVKPKIKEKPDSKPEIKDKEETKE